MRLARAHVDGAPHLVRVAGDTVVPLLREAPWPGADALRSALAQGLDLTTAPAVAAEQPLATAAMLAPVAAPSKVLAIGLNYRDHAGEATMTLPSAPLLFVKTTNAIVGPGAAVTWPKGLTEEVDYEAELAVVIGRRARDVTEADALDHVLGYTCCNDVSARDAQFADKQWVRGKSFDTFCPLGPWIVTADDVPDPQDLRIACRVNGVALQDDTTANMIFSVAEIVSYVSRYLTLEPGDVIATGTPSGVGFARTPPVYLGHGDVVEVEVERVGALRNVVEVTG